MPAAFRLSVPVATLTAPLLTRLAPTLPAVPTPPQLPDVAPVVSTPVLLKPVLAAVPVPRLRLP